MRGTRASPASTTARTPGTVRLDSATAVASTTRRARAPGPQRRVLLGGGQPAVQRQHVARRPRTARRPCAGSPARRAGTRARRRRPRRSAARTARATQASIRSPRAGGTCRVVTGNIRAAHGEHRGPAEQLGEPVGGHGGRGGQQPQVRTQPGAGVQQQREQQVGVEVPLVALVEQHACPRRPAPGRPSAGAAAARTSPPRSGCVATGGTRRAPRSRRSRRPVRRAARPSGPPPPGWPAGAARRPAPGPVRIDRRGQRQRDQRRLAGARRRDQHRGCRARPARR